MNWLELLPPGYGLMRSREGWDVSDNYGGSQTAIFASPSQAISAFLLNYEGECEPNRGNYYLAQDGQIKPYGLVDPLEPLFADKVFELAQASRSRLRSWQDKQVYDAAFADIKVSSSESPEQEHPASE